MSGQLIPPPELAPPPVNHLTQPQRVQLWLDLLDMNEKLLLSALRRQIGPDGDLRAAYRQWYEKRMEQHDEDMKAMARRLEGREGAYVR